MIDIPGISVGATKGLCSIPGNLGALGIPLDTECGGTLGFNKVAPPPGEAIGAGLGAPLGFPVLGSQACATGFASRPSWPTNGHQIGICEQH